MGNRCDRSLLLLFTSNKCAVGLAHGKMTKHKQALAAFCQKPLRWAPKWKLLLREEKCLREGK